MIWTSFTEATVQIIFFLRPKYIKVHISNLGMLDPETETNEEEANEETYHDDKRSRVAVKN